MRQGAAALAGILAIIALTAACSDDSNGSGSTTSSASPSSSSATVEPAPSGDMRLVRGTVSTGGDATIDAVFAIEESTSATPEPGPYDLQFLDADGSVLSSTSLDVLEPVEDGSADDSMIFAVPVPEPGPEAVELRVLRDGEQVGSTSASGAAPTVTITAPSEGETLSDEEVTVAWTGKDADDDGLTYLVAFRAADQTWTTLGIGDQPETVLYPGDYLPGSNGTIRVIASDGFHSSSADLRVVIG